MELLVLSPFIAFSLPKPHTSPESTCVIPYSAAVPITHTIFSRAVTQHHTFGKELSKVNSDQQSELVKQKALRLAAEYGHPDIGTEHLLLGLLMVDPDFFTELLVQMKVNLTELAKLLHEILEHDKQKPIPPPRSVSLLPKAQSALQFASARADRYPIEPLHIFLGLLDVEDCAAAKILYFLGVRHGQRLNETLAMLLGGSKQLQNFALSSGGNSMDGATNSGGSLPGGNRQEFAPLAKRERPRLPNNSILRRFGHDVTEKSETADPIIGRNDEIDRIIQVLQCKIKNNPCLVGEPGVGKTAIVEGLAQRIVIGDVPPEMLDSIIVSVELSGIVAGTKYRGEFEERMKGLVDEAKNDPRIILFIDEIHTVVGAGSAEGALDASQILKPSLSRGEIKCIGATTYGEYRKHIEKDPALERRFQPVQVEEPTPDDTLIILEGVRQKYAEHHKVRISHEALVACRELAIRYLKPKGRFNPDAALALLDIAGSYVHFQVQSLPIEGQQAWKEMRHIQHELKVAIYDGQLETADKLTASQSELEKRIAGFKAEPRPETATVTADDVARAASKWTGIPLTQLSSSEADKLNRLEENVRTRMVGQDEAVTLIVEAVQTARVLKDPNKPIGSFIFLGPTGVGKTELAKSLTAALFDDEAAMIRIDMSEYGEKHTVSRLVGAPPGYVGYDEAGQLTEQVRRKPYCVVLFDEIEKAHADVWNIMLQIMDDGRITDGQGRTVDFKNAVIIMTSNIGAENMKRDSAPFGDIVGATESGDDDFAKVKQLVLDELQRVFKPEWLNRVDEIVVFNPLKREELEKIVLLRSQGQKKRFRDQVKISLDISAEVLALIAREGYDPAFGARPVNRAIFRLITKPLARLCRLGEFNQGDAVIAIAGEDGKIRFTKANQPA
jgi:ATP-dependent Clp protease ATP-binding subunit ClpC